LRRGARGIPVIVDVGLAMSPSEGLLTASSHLVFSSESLQETAAITDDGEALKKDCQTHGFLSGGNTRASRRDLARQALGNCRRHGPSPFTPSTRWVPATYSTAPSR
jgi:hypothetical protein